MFSAFFAAYAVLSGETAGGPSGKQLFNLTSVGLETAFLLRSSFACGVASIGARAREDFMYYGGMMATAVLGAAFLLLELARLHRHDRARRRTGAQRLSIIVFRPGRVPRIARNAGAPLALDDDGAGVRQGLPGRRHEA
jgi:hypothetical protein